MVCINALKKGKKILLTVNGGLAGDAQHMAGEFLSRFNFDRPALSAIELTSDTSILTAIGNDYGYKNVFASQIQALGQKGDISIGVTGNLRGAFIELCDYAIEIPSNETPHIQEGHLVVGHIICRLIEEGIFKDYKYA